MLFNASLCTGPHVDILVTGGALHRAVVNVFWATAKAIQDGLTEVLSEVMGLTVLGPHIPLSMTKILIGVQGPL